jgi:hypothetical protein
VQIATEGALWGAIKAHGLLADTVIVSDDAGQFDVGQHGLCWVHAERLVHKLDTFTDAQRAAQSRIRALIWLFYRNLKALASQSISGAQGDLVGALRSHLQPQDRLRHSRPPARTPPAPTRANC